MDGLDEEALKMDEAKVAHSSSDPGTQLLVTWKCEKPRGGSSCSRVVEGTRSALQKILRMEPGGTEEGATRWARWEQGAEV